MHKKISFLLLLAVTLSACSQIPGLASATPTAAPVAVAPDPRLVVVEGRAVPRDSANLFFTAPGRVTDVLAQEGDQVLAGQVLARQGDRESYAAALTAAQLAVLNAQQQLDQLNQKAAVLAAQAEFDLLAAERGVIEAQARLDAVNTPDYSTRLDALKVTANTDKKTQEDAQTTFDKYVGVDPNNVDRKAADDALRTAQDAYRQAVRARDALVNDLDQGQAGLALAEARLADARHTLDLRQPGPDPDALALAKASLTNAQAQAAAAQAALDNLDLKAPFAGRIVKVDISAGERAVPNQVVMVIADFSAWYVETTDLTENDVVRLSVGQKATLVPDALPDLTLAAEIESISETYTEKSGDVLYKTRLLVTDPGDELRWGMTIEVRLKANSQ